MSLSFSFYWKFAELIWLAVLEQLVNKFAVMVTLPVLVTKFFQDSNVSILLVS